MSDPLSVAAGVAGVVVAAGQISSLLIKFTKSTIAAPQQAKIVLTEVSDIGGILSHLQSLILGLDLPDRSRASLLKVDKVITVISGCVLTFSELEKLLDELKKDNLDILDRLKWARKESALAGLIQRLQNHKISLSLVLDILNGFALICLILLSAGALMLRRHTITEAKESVDRLHALVEKHYSEMSSRVQALEVLSMQQDKDTESLSSIHAQALEVLHMQQNENTHSIAAIRAPRPDASSQEVMETALGDFDFSDELQRSRVYRRNHAFRKSVISALTNSAYSLGWSIFSDLSVAELSNISVINLAVSKEEVFNPGRVLQTWSTQPNTGYSGDYHLDGRPTSLYTVFHGPVQRDFSPSLAQPIATEFREQRLPLLSSPISRSNSPERHDTPLLSSPISRSHSFERHDTDSQRDEHFPEEWSTRSEESSDSEFNLSLEEPSDSLSPLQAEATSSPYSDHEEEDAEVCRCIVCGEVCFTPSCSLTAKLLSTLDWTANDQTFTQILDGVEPSCMSILP